MGMSVLTPVPHQQTTGQQPSRSWDAFSAPRFQTVKFLGRGGQGFVQLAYDNLHKQSVAIKYIDRGWSRGFYKYVLRETLNHQHLSLCKHPHIVEFHEVFLTPSYLAVVMEYVNGTNLQHYLEAAGGKLPEDVARFIFQQLVIAVDFCHKKGKVNRDIKLANILLQEGHLPLVKLCDFGFSKDKFDDSEPQTQIGTALFTAPEIFTNVLGQVYDAEAADVWSCGVVLFVMLFGCHPFLSVEDTQQRKHAQIMKLIENAVRGSVQVPSVADELYPQALDLVRHILVSGPSQRCKLPAIMAHPWFQEKLPPGALLLNAAYLSMEHPVGELRQTPEEVHAIITAALSVSGQDEKSDYHSPAPMGADIGAVSGPPPPPQPVLVQQLAGPMASACGSPLGPQQGHPHLQGATMMMMMQTPGQLQASPAAVQMLGQAPAHGVPSRHSQQQHPQQHPLNVQLRGRPAQQHSALHLMVMEGSRQQQQQQQQHSGNGPTSSATNKTAAAASVAGSMQAAAVATAQQLARQHSVSSEPNAAVARFNPHTSLAASSLAGQQPEAPPGSPMLVSGDGSLRKSSGSVPFAQVGPAVAAALPNYATGAGLGSNDTAAPRRGGVARGNEKGVGGCVLYDSSLLYNLDLQTED